MCYLPYSDFMTGLFTNLKKMIILLSINSAVDIQSVLKELNLNCIFFDTSKYYMYFIPFQQWKEVDAIGHEEKYLVEARF